MKSENIIYSVFKLFLGLLLVMNLYSQKNKVESRAKSKVKKEMKKYETSGLALMFGNTATIISEGHFGLNAAYYWNRFGLLQPSITAGIEYGGLGWEVVDSHWTPYFAGRISYGDSWRFTSSLSFVRDFSWEVTPCVNDNFGNCVGRFAGLKSSYQSLFNVGFEYVSTGGFVFILEIGTPIYRITESRLGDFQQWFLGLYFGYKVW